MSTIPEGLLEQMEEGNLLFFIGDGIVHHAAATNGRAALEGLAAQLVGGAGIVDAQGLAFPAIAQLYEDQRGRDELLRVVRGYFEGLGDSPQVVHHLIAALYGRTEGTILATTCLDGRLERAFEQAGQALKGVIGNGDVVLEGERQTELYKLYGSLERVATTGRLVLTEEDYEIFFEQQGSISVLLQGHLARKTILFVGYDLTTPYFKRLYRKVSAPASQFTRRAYALGAALPAHIASWAKHRQIELIEADPAHFFEFVMARLADKPLHTDNEMQALLLHSALQSGEDAAYWLKRIGDSTRRVELLTQATRSKLALVRQRAVDLLGSQNIPQAVEPLLKVALHEPNPVVRDAACQSLAQLTRQHAAIVARLESEAQGEKTTGSTHSAVLRILTYLPLNSLPLRLRSQVLMIHLRQRLTSLIEAASATPQHRAITMTTGLLLLFVLLAYAFSANAYYVGSRPSTLPEGEEMIVIRRGHPLLKLPGVNQVLVETGIKKSQIAKGQWSAIESEQLWGLSSQTTPAGFYKWGQDVAETLNLEDRVPMLWYLGQEEQALQAILEAMSSPDAELHLASVRLLERVIDVDAAVGQQVLQALFLQLSDEDSDVRDRAASTLAQVAEGNPQLAQQALQALLPRLSDEESAVRKRAASVLPQVVKGNPQLAQQVLQALLPRLSDEESGVRDRAASAVQQVVEGNPELAQQVLQALLPRFLDEESDIRIKAVFVVRQVAQSNPQLAEQVLQGVFPLLEHEDSHVRDSAVSAVWEMTDANPQLAQQVLQDLLPLLEHEDFNVRNRAASALVQMVEDNLELAQQTLQALLLVLEHDDWETRDTAASALGQMAETNPQLTGQVLQALQLRLSDEDWQVRDRAASALRQVVRSNPDLAEQVLQMLRQRLSDEDSRVRYSVTFALAQAVQSNPDLAEEVLQALQPRLSDEDRWVRARVASTMEQVAQANPQFAQQVLVTLQQLLSDEDRWVHDSTATAVRQVAEGYPTLAEQAIEALLPRLSDEDEWVRHNTASAVRQVTEANPVLTEETLEGLLPLPNDDNLTLPLEPASELAQVGEDNLPAPEQVLEALLPLLEHEEREVRNSATSVVGQVTEANPQLAEQALQGLLPLLRHELPDVRDNAIFVIEKIVVTNPAVTEAALRRLQPLLKHEQSYVRDNAAFLVGQVAKANPQLAEEALQALLPLLKDSDNDVRASAASALAQVAQKAEPQLAEEVIQALLPLLEDKSSLVRYNVAPAIARVYAHRQDEAFLFAKLTDAHNALERPVAAKALFLITLQEPIRAQSIRHRLQEQAKSPQPIENIWANKSLAMLDLASQAHQAAELDGEAREEATNRLQNLCQWDENEDRCTTTNFFGEDFAWAVGEALNWLEEQREQEEAE